MVHTEAGDKYACQTQEERIVSSSVDRMSSKIHPSDQVPMELLGGEAAHHHGSRLREVEHEIEAEFTTVTR